MKYAYLLGIISVLLIVGACADDDTDENDDVAAQSTTELVAEPTPTPTMTSAPSPTEPAVARPGATDEDVSRVEESVDRVLGAMHHHDRDRLHDLSDDRVRQHRHDRDFVHLATCLDDVENVEIVDRDVQIDDDHATVTVTLEVTTASGDAETYERVWEFEREPDGDWVLSSLPDCPIGER